VTRSRSWALLTWRAAADLVRGQRRCITTQLGLECKHWTSPSFWSSPSFFRRNDYVSTAENRLGHLLFLVLTMLHRDSSYIESIFGKIILNWSCQVSWGDQCTTPHCRNDASTQQLSRTEGPGRRPLRFLSANLMLGRGSSSSGLFRSLESKTLTCVCFPFVLSVLSGKYLI